MGKLKSMLINRIDLVPEGDNPEAHIVLYKRKPEGGDKSHTVSTSQSSNVKGDEMDLKDVLKKLSKEEGAVVTSALNGKEQKLQKLQKQLDQESDKVKTLSGEVTKLKKSVEDDSKKGSGHDVETVLEKADPKVRELVKGMQARMEDADKQSKEYREKVDALQKSIQKGKFVEMAKGFSNISPKPDELADLLMTVHESSPDAFQKLSTMLKSVNKMLEEADIFKTQGSDQNDDAGSSWSKLSKLSKERAAQKSISIEKAQSEILRENPDLYQAYREESEV